MHLSFSEKAQKNTGKNHYLNALSVKYSGLVRLNPSSEAHSLKNLSLEALLRIKQSSEAYFCQNCLRQKDCIIHFFDVY